MSILLSKINKNTKNKRNNYTKNKVNEDDRYGTPKNLLFEFIKEKSM